MTDRYNPLVHEVNATVRMGAHPDGGYVLASDYDLLVTEHEKTEAELAEAIKVRNDAIAENNTSRARVEVLEREQWLVAECIFQNVSAGEMKHWAQGIKVSLSGADKVPRFTVEREAK